MRHTGYRYKVLEKFSELEGKENKEIIDINAYTIFITTGTVLIYDRSRGNSVIPYARMEKAMKETFHAQTGITPEQIIDWTPKTEMPI